MLVSILYAVSKVYIYFFLVCTMSISLWDSLLFGEHRKDKETRSIFPQPHFISRRAKEIPGTESNQSNLKYLLTRNLLRMISAVSKSTEALGDTTPEANEAPTVLPTTEAPVVPQSVQGLWFCHAHYRSRFLWLLTRNLLFHCSAFQLNQDGW